MTQLHRDGYQLTLHATGDRVHGDLTVTGFNTATAAWDIGWEFAEALRRKFPGATVTADVELKETTP